MNELNVYLDRKVTLKKEELFIPGFSPLAPVPAFESCGPFSERCPFESSTGREEPRKLCEVLGWHPSERHTNSVLTISMVSKHTGRRLYRSNGMVYG